MQFLKFITKRQLSMFDSVGIALCAMLGCSGRIIVSASLFFAWPIVSVILEDFVKAREASDGPV